MKHNGIKAAFACMVLSIIVFLSTIICVAFISPSMDYIKINLIGENTFEYQPPQDNQENGTTDVVTDGPAEISLWYGLNKTFFVTVISIITVSFLLFAASLTIWIRLSRRKIC